MPEKQISNANQSFSLGATWGNPSVDNAMTTQQCDLINGTGTTLYTGDIVGLDPTGTQAVQLTTATLSLSIGTVGSTLEASAYPAVEVIAGSNVTNTFPTIVGSTGGTGISFLTADGNIAPNSDYAWASVAVGYTNGSANVTSALVSASNPFVVGNYIITPYNASTNANPQIFQITVAGGSSGSWTATGVVIAGAGTTFTGTTGTYTSQVGRDTATKGPGWIAPPGWSNSSAFEPGVIVPIVTQGLGRMNINGLTTGVAGSFGIGTNASFVATLVLITALTAAQIGLVIGTWLEAYAQRDTTINTTFGISGHDSVRAIIGKM